MRPGRLHILTSLMMLTGCAHHGAAQASVDLDARVLAPAEVGPIRLAAMDLPGVIDAKATLLETLPALSHTASAAWHLHIEQSAERRVRLRAGKPRVGQFQNNLSGLDSASGRNERGPAFNRAGRSGGGSTRAGVLLKATLSPADQPGLQVWRAELWVPRAAYERCASFWVKTLAQTLGETVRRQEPAHCPSR